MIALRRSVAAAACTVAVAAIPAATAVAADPPVKVSARPVAAALSTKAKTVTVVVTNASRRRQSGLTLSVASAKGVKVVVAGAGRGRTTRALPPLRAGRSARIAVKVSRTSRGPSAARLAVKVRRGRKTLATARISFGARRPGATEPAQPPANPNSLEGRYFWGSRYTLNGIQQNTLWFTGPNLVWVEPTESAWPTCAAVSEQCKSYSYDASANALTIDGKPATLTGRGLEWDDDSYREFGFPKAGTRWDTYVTYSNSSGVCPLYCSYYTENLAFRPDGTFIRDAVSSGTGPVIDWGVVPPDSKGTYEVRADRTLRLAYADGRERIETVANYLDDDGSLQAVGEGLLLGGDGYFDIRD